MAEDADNHTIRLLQEMRKEINQRFDEIDQRFDAVDLRIDGLTHIMTMLAGNMGGHDRRIGKLKDALRPE